MLSTLAIKSSKLVTCPEYILGRQRIRDRGSKNLKMQSEHDYATTSKSYQKFQGSRKLDCPAEIQIMCIRVLTECEVDKSSCHTQNGIKIAKQSVLKKLKNDLTSEDNRVLTMTRFYVKIPLCMVHRGHPVGKSGAYNQSVDKRI